MWKRRKTVDRVKALEDRLDRVAIRQVVSEIMLATAIGFVLRSVGEGLRRDLVRELRANVRVDVRGFPDPDAAELAAIEMEERFDQLLDQIEHLARILEK